ncbi:MAG: phosphoribosyltransferase [Dehalococcoidia bacterium]|nr:phosphoribosyltransferase [Dehalococcoidia bacterium]
MERQFTDRREAGRLLAEILNGYDLPADAVVLGLARGGVPVAYEVASALGLEMDVILVRKLGVPLHPELAMGAIASGGVRVLNQDIIDELRIRPDDIERVAGSEERELRRRELAYRDGRKSADVHSRTVVLVDDGLATGASMRAAVEAVRQMGAARVVVGVPVAAAETCAELEAMFPNLECACPLTPSPFYAVGLWYREFRATSDDEVRELLARAAVRRDGAGERRHEGAET